jgi:hypothetical protein
MTDTLTVRPDPANPVATVVDHNGIPFVYVYPTAWDGKWTWASRYITGIPDLFDTEVETWANIRFVANLITHTPVMARQLVAICKAKEAPNA